MTTKVQKWGNSLAVRLPRQVAAKFGLGVGTPVVISPARRSIVVKPAERKRRFTLRELVRQITPQNRHKLLLRGRPMGREIW